MTADEWEATFHGIELPEKVELGPGVTINGVREFLEKSITILRAGNARVSEPIEWRLQALLDILNQKNDEELPTSGGDPL